jgi:hypothetical protein
MVVAGASQAGRALAADVAADELAGTIVGAFGEAPRRDRETYEEDETRD